MNSRLWITGLLVVLTTTACGADEPAGPSPTIATASWQYELRLSVDAAVATGRDDTELTVEVVNGIGEAPSVVHRAPVSTRSASIDLDDDQHPVSPPPGGRA
ncbi:MAG: hypothetical protein QNJ88_16470 [Acidimicrobiia bacterium]|nr:hypothetical protein [Acidimicrobiia bacterium]